MCTIQQVLRVFSFPLYRILLAYEHHADHVNFPRSISRRLFKQETKIKHSSFHIAMLASSQPSAISSSQSNFSKVVANHVSHAKPYQSSTVPSALAVYVSTMQQAVKDDAVKRCITPKSGIPEKSPSSMRKGDPGHRNPACRCNCFSILSLIHALLKGRYAVILASNLQSTHNIVAACWAMCRLDSSSTVSQRLIESTINQHALEAYTRALRSCCTAGTSRSQKRHCRHHV